MCRIGATLAGGPHNPDTARTATKSAALNIFDDVLAARRAKAAVGFHTADARPILVTAGAGLHTSDRHDMLADSPSRAKLAFNCALGADVGGGLGAIRGALPGYDLGHMVAKPSDAMVDPFAIGGGAAGAILGGVLGRGKKQEETALTGPPTSLRSLLLSAISQSGNSDRRPAHDLGFPPHSDVTVRIREREEKPHKKPVSKN